VLKGAPWNSAINPKKTTSIVMRVDSTYQTQATLMPADLWRVASTSTSHEFSFPISMIKDTIFCGMEIHQQGQTADILFVEHENPRSFNSGTASATV